MSAVALPLVLPSALLDSTVPFGVAALAACLLGTRLLREPRGGRIRDPRLVGLGLALGLAALTRNEAIWIALAWAALAWWQGPDGRTVRESRAMRARLVLVPAVVAIAVVAPWLVRQAIVFGSPLPGQAITNAWAISGFEIFAWKEPATLAGYLAAGPGAWLGDRVGGFSHNLVSVLVLPGMPVAAVGLAGLPWVARSRSLRLLRRLRGGDVRDHDAGLPRPDHLGHLPPRGGAGPRPADRQRARRARRRSRVGRPATRRGRVRLPGSARCSRARVRSSSWASGFPRTAATRPAPRRATPR